MGQVVDSSQASKLVQTGQTDLLGGFISMIGHKFAARLTIQEGKVTFEFPTRMVEETVPCPLTSTPITLFPPLPTANPPAAMNDAVIAPQNSSAPPDAPVSIQNSTYAAHEPLDRLSRKVAGLNIDNNPISGVIAERLIFTAPVMFPRKVWGGPRGWPSPRRIKRLFNLLGIAHGTPPPSNAFLLRFEVNASDWVPYPDNPPFWALASPHGFKDDHDFTLCKEREKANDDNADMLVQAKLSGLDVRSKAGFLFGGSSKFVEVAICFNNPAPALFDVRIVWKHQADLACLIKKVFPDAIQEYSPPWLGWQRLDVYVPSRLLAFEYQGEQHYRPIGFFGGEGGYANLLMRDRQKKSLCAANGITLIEWKYSTPISQANLVRHLNSVGIEDIRPIA